MRAPIFLLTRKTRPAAYTRNVFCFCFCDMVRGEDEAILHHRAILKYTSNNLNTVSYYSMLLIINATEELVIRQFSLVLD